MDDRIALIDLYTLFGSTLLVIVESSFFRGVLKLLSCIVDVILRALRIVDDGIEVSFRSVDPVVEIRLFRFSDP